MTALKLQTLIQIFPFILTHEDSWRPSPYLLEGKKFIIVRFIQFFSNNLYSHICCVSGPKWPDLWHECPRLILGQMVKLPDVTVNAVVWCWKCVAKRVINVCHFCIRGLLQEGPRENVLLSSLVAGSPGQGWVSWAADQASCWGPVPVQLRGVWGDLEKPAACVRSWSSAHLGGSKQRLHTHQPGPVWHQHWRCLPHPPSTSYHRRFIRIP